MARRRTYDVANEQAVIVAALKDDVQRRKIVSFVIPEMFCGVPNKEIYKTLLECGGVVDEHRIVAGLNEGDASELRLYVKKLFESDVPIDVDHHLNVLLSRYAYQQAKIQAVRLVDTLDDPTLEFEAYQRASNAVSEALCLRLVTNKNAKLKTDYLDNLRKRRSGDIISFCPTGWGAMDEYLTEGVAPGGITVIAGETGMGKTSVVCDFVIRQVQLGKRVLVEALEQGKLRMLDKLVARFTGVGITALVKNPQDMPLVVFSDVEQSISELLELVTVVDLNDLLALGSERRFDRLSSMDILDRSEKLIVGGNYDIVVSDMFERKLFSAGFADMNFAVQREQYTAKKYLYHSVIVHQMREPDSKKGEEDRPDLGRLFGKGKWGQVPDMIIGIYRDKVKYPQITDDIFELILLKQRLGPAGVTVLADFDPETGTLENLRPYEDDD